MNDDVVISTVGPTEYESMALLPSNNEFLTYDKEIVRHIITDETLSMLDYAKRDLEFEGALLFGGLSLGALIPFIEACILFRDESEKLSGLNLTAMLVFCVSAGLTLMCWLLFHRKDKVTVDVIKQIRARTKMRIEREKNSGAKTRPPVASNL